MRLTTEEQTLIVHAIRSVDSNVEIFLYGSRVDDNERGGDIDILCFSTRIDRPMIRAIKRRIIDQLGEQKIDLLVEKDLEKPFTRLIMQHAIPLT